MISANNTRIWISQVFLEHVLKNIMSVLQLSLLFYVYHKEGIAYLSPSSSTVLQFFWSPGSLHNLRDGWLEFYNLFILFRPYVILVDLLPRFSNISGALFRIWSFQQLNLAGLRSYFLHRSATDMVRLIPSRSISVSPQVWLNTKIPKTVSPSLAALSQESEPPWRVR